MNVMLSNQVLTKINFFKKNHSQLDYILVWIARLVHICSRIIMFGLIGVFKSNSRIKMRAYWFTLGRFIKSDY